MGDRDVVSSSRSTDPREVRTLRDVSSAPNTGAPEPGTVIAGKYRLDSKLGEGGNAVVYAATNLLTEKKLAVKWLHARLAGDADAIERLLREARAAGAIEHPNIVDVIDVGREGDTPFLVMELLRGEPLSARLTDAPLEPAEIIRLLMPALRGIDAAHRRGILHRDLKPENIFVQTDGQGAVLGTKVLDFGISKDVGDRVRLESMTDSGTVIGTPSYMSPEQIRGRRDLDVRTDVYSIGVILYEALTGELPFDADTLTDLAIVVWTGWLRPPRMLAPSLDRRLETVLMRALARERDARFPDIATLARALEPFAEGVRFDEARPSRSMSPTPVVDEARVARESAPTVAMAAATTATRSIALPPAPWARRPFAAAALIALALLASGVVWLSTQGGSSATPAAPERAARTQPEAAPAPHPTPEPEEPPAAPPPRELAAARPLPEVRAEPEAAPTVPASRARGPRLPAPRAGAPEHADAPEPSPPRARLRTERLTADEF